MDRQQLWGWQATPASLTHSSETLPTTRAVSGYLCGSPSPAPLRMLNYSLLVFTNVHFLVLISVLGLGKLLT